MHSYQRRTCNTDGEVIVALCVPFSRVLTPTCGAISFPLRSTIFNCIAINLHLYKYKIYIKLLFL